MLRWMIIFFSATAFAQQTNLMGSLVNGVFTPWTSPLMSGQVPTPPSITAKCKNGNLTVDCAQNGGGGNTPSGGGNPVLSGLVAEYQYLPTESGTSAKDYSGNNHSCVFGTGAQAPTRTQYGLNFAQPSQQYCDTGISFGSAQTLISYIQFPAIPNANLYTILYGGSLANQGLYLTTELGHAPAQFGLVELFGVVGAGRFNIENALPGYGVLAWVRNSGGDLLYYNGQLVFTASSGSGGITAGTFWIGGCNAASGQPCASAGMDGNILWTDIYSSALTPSQITAVTNFQANQIAAKGYIVPSQTPGVGPIIAVEGDSISAGQQTGTATPPTNYLTINQSPTILLMAIGGEGLNEMFARRARVNILSSATAQNNTLLLWGGTNNLLNGDPVLTVAAEYAAYGRSAQAAGWNAFAFTVLDRLGLNVSIKNQFNTIVRANWKAWGFAGLMDIAADPHLGADGASTHTSSDPINGCASNNYFNTDQTHPLTCADSGNIGPEESSGINYFYGSNLSSPTVVAANTYTVLNSDGYISWTPTGAATGTLPECLALTGRTFTITNNSAVSTITVSGAGSETITGLATIAGGVTATFLDVLTSAATGGCYWVRQ